MAGNDSGLRFDVYERVHLSVDVADIHELEEIELTPRLTVFQENDTVALRGNLLLSGVYVSQTDEQRVSRKLEHWIPVEISLPINRVSQLGDITVEIENFDVDLLSARTLNITGVLSLRGVEVQVPETTSSWQEEDFTVVHRREYRREEAAEPIIQPAQPGIDPFLRPYEGDQQVEENEAESVFISEVDLGPVQQLDDPQFRPDGEETLPPPQTDTYWAENTWAKEKSGDTADEVDGTIAREIAFVQTQDAESVEAATPEPPESTEPPKKEMKVALGAKPPQEQVDPNKAGLLTLLGANREPGNRDPAGNSLVQEPVKEEPLPAAEDIQWQNLFIGDKKDQRDFRRLRMCIVQREETLESIAGRYHLNPREILLYNRLDEGNLSAGQILYIP
jgi:stage VI sporulation protein D